MRALDTNVLARFFVDDPDDPQARLQRPAAVTALSERSFVSVTVMLELEWVLRGFCALAPKDVSRVLRALASIPHVTIEDRDLVLAALDAFDHGLDLPMPCICRAVRGRLNSRHSTGGSPGGQKVWD